MHSPIPLNDKFNCASLAFTHREASAPVYGDPHGSAPGADLRDR